MRFLEFFFSSRRRHTRLVSDWSSDVCSSDLDQASLGPFILTSVVKHEDEALLRTLEAITGGEAEGSRLWLRSEERRVGKEWRLPWSAGHRKKKTRAQRRKREQ